MGDDWVVQGPNADRLDNYGLFDSSQNYSTATSREH